MNRRYYNWIRFFIFSAFLFSIVIPVALNIVIDPYTIYHTHILKRDLSPNQRFNKIEYLKQHPHLYNSYMLGNSRIGTTDPKILERYIPASRFYNLTLSTGNMEDMITHLEYLIRHGYRPKNIYLQLDYQDMIYWGHNPENYEYKKHPDVTQTSHLKFYLEYGLIFPFLNFKEKLALNLSPVNEREVIQDIKTGMWIAAKKEKMILNDPERYVRLEPSFHAKTVDIWEKDEIAYQKMIAALKEIVHLCRQNQITLILYTTPCNHAMLNNFKTQDILNYLKDIANIHDYYFFSDYNSITLDNTNYYESGHFRGKVGELIAARIFNDPALNVPSDFGLHISKFNFSAHKEAIKTNFAHHRTKIFSTP